MTAAGGVASILLSPTSLGSQPPTNASGQGASRPSPSPSPPEAIPLLQPLGMACMPRARAKDSWPSVPSTPFWTSPWPYPYTTSLSMTVCRFPALGAPKYRQCLGSRAQYLSQSGTIRGPCSSERINVTGTPFNTNDDKWHTSSWSFPNPALCIWPASLLTPPWM